MEEQDTSRPYIHEVNRWQDQPGRDLLTYKYATLIIPTVVSIKECDIAIVEVGIDRKVKARIWNILPTDLAIIYMLRPDHNSRPHLLHTDKPRQDHLITYKPDTEHLQSTRHPTAQQDIHNNITTTTTAASTTTTTATPEAATITSTTHIYME
ncbi:hypothetical protein Pmani_020175 [Petrolisthes manimaculis]|uniref:Uncharacterized protein n=1 Tax=Petrolisthes manimaculis TaxID=1843537 RepID=A0AAE1PJ91_9EUCA|nr:hypothetical protein Pmani_020175 [Petrolisthes manimaculis]